MAHMRSGPVLRDGTNTSRYDMNMTGYRELSVTPLSLRKHASEGTCLRYFMSRLSMGTSYMSQVQAQQEIAP